MNQVLGFWYLVLGEAVRPSADLGLGLGHPRVTQGSPKRHPRATQGPPKRRFGVRALFSTKAGKRGVGSEIAVIAVIARDRVTGKGNNP